MLVNERCDLQKGLRYRIRIYALRGVRDKELVEAERELCVSLGPLAYDDQLLAVFSIEDDLCYIWMTHFYLTDVFESDVVFDGLVVLDEEHPLISADDNLVFETNSLFVCKA